MSDPTGVVIAAAAVDGAISVTTLSSLPDGRSDVVPNTRKRVGQVLRTSADRRDGQRSRATARLIDLVFNDLDSPWAVEIQTRPIGPTRTTTRTSRAAKRQLDGPAANSLG